ncbi:hypothetical protein [Streptomyces sp. H23]|uniref:hypothetical protein n=1 Tax=Streptomyces sp. H23 TaxID=2541723 RepID=UPI00106E7C3B|nr:hypothetical protein [Streptomyces sp. H23]
MLVEFPAGTHLDRSRASSGGMRGTARNDRDNSLVAQAELFDADDRYDEGYRDGLRNFLVNCATDIAVEVARTVTVAAVEVATPYLKDGARRFKEKVRRKPKDTPAAEVVQEAAPERPTASGLRPVTAAANGHDQVGLVLRADQGDASVQAALERINTRAAETYGIAAHYSAGLPAADVVGEAMRQALATAAPGYIAAALERLAFDDELGLTPASRCACGIAPRSSTRAWSKTSRAPTPRSRRPDAPDARVAAASALAAPHGGRAAPGPTAGTSTRGQPTGMT